jgi:hypothetical protein
MGRGKDRQHQGRVPGELGTHVGKARAEIGALSDAWLRAGRCHYEVAAWAQREPDWAKVEAKAGRARKAAAKHDPVATSLFAGVVGVTALR